MGSKPRDWYVPLAEYATDDQDVLADELMRIVWMLTRIGGAQMIVADRREIEPGTWATVGFTCRWESYTPGVRAEPAPEPEPEPVA